MLNAALAVVRRKRAIGFYRDGEAEGHTTYSLFTNTLNNEDAHEPSSWMTHHFVATLPAH